MPWTEACKLVKRVCRDFDIPPPRDLVGPSPPTVAIMVAGEPFEVVEVPKRPRPVTVLHLLAHVLTDPAFPPHGAEFCARWLELVERYAPATPLRAQLEALNVHHSVERRARTARGNATYKATHRRGAVVEVVLDDPPECKRGSIEGVDGDELFLGGEVVPLDRVRYVYEWGTAR